ncbi:MAG TPA: alpha/beta fold hydrolase [Ktedonobacteraceae bacterium]|jgi:pimeloyl-ACP methyl ester carboxylesterase
MPVYQTQHTRLYYDLFPSESARTLLLVHGFAGTPTSDFADQLPAFRLHYRVLAPHLHGYGRSTPRQSYTLTYYRQDVADLVSLLDHLGETRVYVVGFSDGAIVSLLLAALYPTRVRALAALGAQPTIDTDNTAAIRHWLLERPLSEDWQRQLAELHGAPYWRSLPALYVQAQEALVAAGGVLITDEELAAITCPTLIMHGTRDRIVPVTYAHLLHQKIAGARLHLFAAGHPAHLRYPEAYTALVLDFLKEA